MAPRRPATSPGRAPRSNPGIGSPSDRPAPDRRPPWRILRRLRKCPPPWRIAERALADGSITGTATPPPAPSPAGERRRRLAEFRHLRAAGFAAGIAFAALVAIVATLFTINQYLARHAESRVEQTDAVITALRRSARLLREVEYNIFREAVRPGSVEPARVAEIFRDLDASVDKIPQIVADNPVQLVRADRLRELARTLPRREDGAPLIGGPAAEPALAAIDEAEVITRVMADVENALRRVREDEVERYAERARILALLVFLIGSGIGAAALALATVLLRRHVALQNEHVAQLALARDAADAANQAKTRFVQAASHDLRQPLHALALFASALRRRVSGDETLRLVGQIDAAIASMTGMFATLLDVARLEAGVVVPHFRACRLDEIFHRLRSEFAHRAAAKGLRSEEHTSELQ